MTKNSTIMILAILLSMMLNACVAGKTANPKGSVATRYQVASSTKIGCLPDEITITDLDQHGGFDRTRNWFATCNGQKYFYTGVNDGHGGTKDVSCMKRSSNDAAVAENPVKKKSKK